MFFELLTFSFHRIDTTSTLSAQMTKLHNDKEIACVADNEGYEDLPLPPAKTRLEVRCKSTEWLRQSRPRPLHARFAAKQLICLRCDLPSCHSERSNICWSRRFISMENVTEASRDN